MVNYAPHMPKGSEHKLYTIDPDLSQPLNIHPDSVGGTPAGRMIHAESDQLLIGHHVIDVKGNVRTISPQDMPMRVTAMARHLEDPVNMVYYIDMEGAVWEANVHTLAVNRLYEKPVPGWHGKGGYSGQGRLIVSNNGEHKAGSYDPLVVGGPAKPGSEQAGVLAEWDGKDWRIIERRQYTEVTGPAGIAGGGAADDPVWAIGWDRRSLRLKLLEDGRWHTYLLPKATHNNDARHGWYTEWPRIRQITGGRWMMDMHGMFFDFPPTFSTNHSAGLRPIASHLRYIPDFCDWNGQLVLASDETSIQGNRLAGQPQSNLWFGSYEELKTWGPANAYGGPWIQDAVKADIPSDPFLVAGFDQRVLHLAVDRKKPVKTLAMRATDQQEIKSMPESLASLPRVTVRRGDWHKPAPGYAFEVDQDVTVYLAVDRRGQPELDASWEQTGMRIAWGRNFRDDVYKRDFPAGTVRIPGNNAEHTPGSFGMPHTAFVAGDTDLQVKVLGAAHMRRPVIEAAPVDSKQLPVVFTIQIDEHGNGRWKDHARIEVPTNGYTAHILPEDLDATWLRLRTNRDCFATAYLHQTNNRYPDGAATKNRALFDRLAEADSASSRAALLYAAKRNRNLRLITGENRHLEFTKAEFEFVNDQPDAALRDLLKVEPEFTVDAASVILRHNGVNYRLPKGHNAFDQPFESGWPRASREVQSERHLANIHGTFYEVPLITNGQPPAFDLMRPVASHNKKISDFCTWNGLLVLAGVRADAAPGEHVFVDTEKNAGLWFGGVDDLWKLGKPVGRGGPWKNTSAKAGAPSDPYLMTGYDRKTLTLRADTDTRVNIEVDFDHQSGWRLYKTIGLKAGQAWRHRFPDAFSAHWIRFTSSQDAVVSAILEYK
jgi:hypothetical protein